MSRAGAIGLIGGLTAVLVAAGFLVPAIPQDPAYHRLADARGWLGVPNAGFVLVGIVGLGFLGDPGAARRAFREPRERWPYAVFFAGLVLTGLGSAYYHWAPGSARLAWDRLPLAITLVGLLDAVVAERVGVRAALRLLGPLVAIAAGSVGYWVLTEQRGAGDLRPYALVQFYPLVAVPLMLWLLPARYTGSAGLLAAAGIYAVAKLPELADAWVFSTTRVISGHTIKHLVAALAGYSVLRMLRQRRAV